MGSASVAAPPIGHDNDGMSDDYEPKDLEEQEEPD